jgi:hypothetical protein
MIQQLHTIHFLCYSSIFQYKYVSIRQWIYIILQYWGLNSGPTSWATHQLFFVMGFFEIGSCELFAWVGFEPTHMILLISASWVAGMTGMSQWRPAVLYFLNGFCLFSELMLLWGFCLCLLVPTCKGIFRACAQKQTVELHVSRNLLLPQMQAACWPPINQSAWFMNSHVTTDSPVLGIVRCFHSCQSDGIKSISYKLNELAIYIVCINCMMHISWLWMRSKHFHRLLGHLCCLFCEIASCLFIRGIFLYLWKSFFW